MKKIYLFLLLFFTFGFTFAQINVNQLFSNHPEVIIKFQIQERNQLEWLTRIISIDKVFENEVTAYTTREEFEHFLSLNIPFEIVERPILTPEELNMLDFEAIQQCRNDWNYYPTYDAYLAMMAKFAVDYPELCRLVEFGTSVQNRKLQACVISKNVNVREAEPQVFWSSSMHGDELTGYVLTLRFIDYLLTNYGTNERVTYLLDNMEIWVNPIANPDGTFKGTGGTVSGATRSNANGKDLNRNYPDDTNNGNPGDGPVQKETTAFIALQQVQTFTLAVNLHGGVEACNYPWDNKTTKTADHNWWVFVCREYADTVHVYNPNYMTDYENGIVWGPSMYTIKGGRQDYANYYDHTREFTLEISDPKTIAASQLPNYWNAHYRSFLNYTQQALYGIQGVVTDACTGEPLHAKISLPNDIHNSFVWTDPRVGFYARYLKAGTYSVTYSADGYISQTVSLTVADKEQVVQNIQLMPASLPIIPVANFEANHVEIQKNDTVYFTDLSNDAISWEWTFEGGTPQTSIEQNPIVVYENLGTFDVILTVYSEDCKNKMLKEKFITVNSPPNFPVANFEADKTKILENESVYFSDLSQNATAWEWFFEGGTPETSTEKKPVIAYNNKGAFDVKLKVTNSFGSDEILKPKYITVEDIKVDENSEIQLKIYPNPTTGKLIIDNGQLTIDNVVIYDIYGRKVFEQKSNLTVLLSCDLTVLPNGIYFLKISTEKGVHFSKIIIQ